MVREVWATTSDPSLRLKWSEVPLTFSQADHPTCVQHPSRYPIVVEPTVQNIRLGRVLVDTGSSVNLLFVDTLDALHISRSSLRPSPPFFEITPGTSAKPLGQIELPVTFGSLVNFRTERVLFDVANFGTAYNTILGRPAMTQFMAITHYAYQVIKILEPTWAITINGSSKTALHYDKRSLDMVELTPGSHPLTMEPRGRPKKVHIVASPDDRLKAVSLDDTNPTKSVQIGATLDSK
ncbi:uncharacterized protein LOC133904322 [Phragmites australis]|uniref:uncharacterized protein LOC133904322 n=1 Tax=Phragmites australis TaxID=29695 RepID=UPI002D76A89D|nr:uncharacterized protein LOC133904322 [Phragmites australis]